ncbi:MAG TPA: ATPase [Fibrobacteraceae bacterium]|jgi:V/A-type H+-transporting ATPase subunit E|nr:ATPase [Fibrobacter sp.]HPW95028.1 ATPase [Fibrobacteraceae bacterium]
MAEDLQYLIDRIQKDAIDKADNDATSILTAAKEKAAQIIKEAEAEAKAKLEQADKDAQVYTERSERALEQSARDILITVGKSLEKMILDILDLQVEKALSESTIKELLLSLAKNYSSDVEVALSESDVNKLTSFILGEFKKQLSAGVQVESDSSVRFGFRVKLDGGKVSHEFTNEAMADALSALLRPQLAKVVTKAASQGK